MRQAWPFVGRRQLRDIEACLRTADEAGGWLAGAEALDRTIEHRTLRAWTGLDRAWVPLAAAHSSR
ncbi:MAG TPA: hypothetical protein VH912_05545 [Streptosporangiaceae bacterium]|jgi:hypothetical protein